MVLVSILLVLGKFSFFFVSPRKVVSRFGTVTRQLTCQMCRGQNELSVLVAELNDTHLL